MSKATIEDVRRALWNAYSEATSSPEYMGKSSEAYVELYYPNFFECKTLEEFMKPKGLMVYSYALGPSRQHYFDFSDKESQPEYYMWRSPDPFAKAIEVIGEWMKEFRERDET